MKRIATTAVVLALFAVPASALASSSTCQAYSHQTCSVSAITQGQGPTGSTLASSTTTTTSAGSLPFTGLDLGLLVIGGASLLGAGVFARRLSRRLN